MYSGWWGFGKFLLPGGHFFARILCLVLIYTAFVIWWDDHLFPTKKFTEINTMLYSSAIMGILLVFRTNSAYDRWWEARKLWGQLVNDSRNLSIKLKSILPDGNARCRQIAALLIEFPQVLRDHLRGKMKINVNKNATADPCDHVPLRTAQSIYEHLAELKREGTIDGFELLQVDAHARALMDICGACERIVNSPIAGSYKFMIWAGVIVYLGLVPWLLVPVFDMWSILLVLASAYFVLGIEILAEEIERPFGLTPNDLPLDSICSTISDSVKFTFGSGEYDSLKPVNDTSPSVSG